MSKNNYRRRKAEGKMHISVDIDCEKKEGTTTPENQSQWKLSISIGATKCGEKYWTPKCFIDRSIVL